MQVVSGHMTYSDPFRPRHALVSSWGVHAIRPAEMMQTLQSRVDLQFNSQRPRSSLQPQSHYLHLDREFSIMNIYTGPVWHG